MMYLPLPHGHPDAGPCKINGLTAEYRVRPKHVEYRHAESDEWTRCPILVVDRSRDHVVYLCESGGAGGTNTSCPRFP